MMEDTETLMGEFSNEMKYLLPDEAVTEVELEETLKDYASIDLVNEKFQEAINAGFKVTVVDVLPTENISHQIIYLVPNNDTEEQNIHDEFVYTTNNTWEKIGSTKTDLSNYYTKDEVDNIIDNIGMNVTILPLYTNDETLVATHAQAILDHIKTKGISDLIVDLKYIDNTLKRTLCTNISEYDKTIYLEAMIDQNTSVNSNGIGYRKFKKGTFNIKYIDEYVYSNVQNKINIDLYIPDAMKAVSKDEVPAKTSQLENDSLFVNEEFVNNALAGAGSDVFTFYTKGSGTKFLDEDADTKISQLFAALQNNEYPNVYINLNDDFVYTLSYIRKDSGRYRIYCERGTHGSYAGNYTKLHEFNYIIITINFDDNGVTSYIVSHNNKHYTITEYQQFLTVNNEIEYDPTGDYHPATKKYVDDSVSPTIVITEDLTSSENLSKLQTIYDAYVNDYKILNATFYQTSKYMYKALKLDYISIPSTGNPYMYFSSGINSQYGNSDSNKCCHYAIELTLTEGIISSATFTRADYYYLTDYGKNTGYYGALSTKNTRAFTPTDDYNPATKKYVDDSITNIDVGLPYNMLFLPNASVSSSDYPKLEEFINTIKNTDGNAKGLIICGGYMGFPGTIMTLEVSSGATTIKARSIFNIGRLANEISISENKYATWDIYGSWSSNKFTITRISTNTKDRYKVLDTANTTEFTPTSDYHPATKKYVDDAVANAGSSEPIYVYSINKYIYGNTVSTLDTDDVAGLQSVISKFLDGEENKAILSLIIRGADACLTTIDGEVVDLVLDKTKFENSGIISLYSKTIPRSTKFQKYELRLNTTIDEGFTLNTAIIYNTTSEIITKSSVNNAITEALGDVNTILATLTTVEEGE